MILTLSVTLLQFLKKKNQLHFLFVKKNKNIFEIILSSIIKNKQTIFIFGVVCYSILIHLLKNKPLLNYLFLLIPIDIYYFHNKCIALKLEEQNFFYETDGESDREEIISDMEKSKMKQALNMLYSYLKHNDSLIEFDKKPENTTENTVTFEPTHLKLSDTLIHTLENVNK